MESPWRTGERPGRKLDLLGHPFEGPKDPSCPICGRSDGNCGDAKAEVDVTLDNHPSAAKVAGYEVRAPHDLYEVQELTHGIKVRVRIAREGAMVSREVAEQHDLI